MSPKMLLSLLVPMVALALPASASAGADHTKMCLFSRAVDRVRVLDRDHIVFFMKDGAAWENTLWKTCYRLRPEAYLDWGQDDWDEAVCTWPQSGPPFPIVDGRNPADVRPRFSVSLRNGLGHCRLGWFTPYRG
ncbi:MAG TPA: hypothetical protein VKZ79_15825 [Alphaproteobacteria bacterium]|nr:hypothetical protein [Alphaproteobacteria bacterium]